MLVRSRFVIALVTLVLVFHPRSLFAQDGDVQKISPEASKAAADKFEDEGEGKESDFIRKRMQWFHDQRAFPHKTIPSGIRQSAVRERDDRDALEASLRRALATGAATPTGPAWQLIGPRPTDWYYGGTSGRVTSLAIDPANPKILYMGGAEGGVWKSVDGGATWSPLTDTQASLAVGSIALDPSNPNTVYVGTGEENFSGDSYYGAGILKSTDGGLSWTQYTGDFGGSPCGGQHIGAVAVDPANSKIVLAGGEGCYYGTPTIYRSADGGQTWTPVLSPPSSNWVPATAIVFNPANGNLVYAATYDDGVFKSTDAGKTWSAANGTGNNALPTKNLGRIALALAPSNPSILYAAIADASNSDLLGLYKSVDGGGNWALLPNTPDFCSTQCWYDIVLAVSPTNPNFVAAGGVYPYHPGGSAVMTSADGGTTWVDQSNGLHPDTHALAFTPDGTTLYTGSDGGVWSTTNPTASKIAWTGLNSTLAITEFYPGMAIDQSNLNHSYIGTQDNGMEKYSGSLLWSAPACGDGGAAALDYTATGTVYVNCIELSLYKTTDDGNTFNQVTDGFASGDRTGWVPPLAMDPLHHNTLYFGTYRVYRTTNGAALWTPISGDISGDPTYGTLDAIAIAPTDPNTVYAGSNYGQVYVTHNAQAASGVQWTNVTGAGLPGRSVTWIAVDPTSASIAYVGCSGFTGFGDSLGHIFKTSNAGVTWTDVSGDLPNTPVNAILVDPDAPDTIFAGTDIGAFYTSNGGGSWSTLGAGLPTVVVTGLGLHEATRTLRASTHGRSVWDLNIASLLPIPTIAAVSPTTILADSAASKLTVTGVQFKSTSVVVWNGAPLTTAFVNSGEITATVPAADLAKGETVTIRVMNGAGGKLSNSATLTVENPLPTLTAFSRKAIPAGSAGFTLTVGGTDYVTTSKIEWKGVALATTFGSKTWLTVPIPASDLVTAGTALVEVINPAPGGGTSAPLTFTIDNLVPVAKAISPTSAKAGGASFLLTLTGADFAAGARVLWNGTALTTTVVSPTKLTAAIAAAELAKAGTATVKASNAAPGGGPSAAALTFTIDNPLPVASALSPVSAKVGGAAFTLTVTGSNFVSTSKVRWNGTSLVTTWVSATKLTAAVPAADIATATTAAVTVISPAPGGGTSAALKLPVK